MIGRKSLNCILGSFKKTLIELSELQKRNGEEAGRNSAVIVSLRERNEALFAEATQAGRIQDKLTELIA